MFVNIIRGRRGEGERLNLLQISQRRFAVCYKLQRLQQPCLPSRRHAAQLIRPYKPFACAASSSAGSKARRFGDKQRGKKQDEKATLSPSLQSLSAVFTQIQAIKTKRCPTVNHSALFLTLARERQEQRVTEQKKGFPSSLTYQFSPLPLACSLPS